VLKEREPCIGVSSNDDSAVVLELLAWCRTEDFFDTQYYLTDRVKLALEEAGIKIPYPHLVVQMG
jgi:small conductance mechanosensitive channel